MHIALDMLRLPGRLKRIYEIVSQFIFQVLLVGEGRLLQARVWSKECQRCSS